MYEIMQRALELICAVAVGAIVTAGAAYWIAKTITPAIQRMKQTGWAIVLALPLVVSLIYIGSTKNGSVSYPYTDVEKRYLIDTGSYVTNDYIHVSFSRSVIVPDEADLQIWYRPAGSTNDAEWAQLLNTTFTTFSCPSNVPFAGAHTNDIQIFTTWSPGPAAHTNGVAQVLWKKRSINDENMAASPFRTGIYMDGERVAPNPAITNGPNVEVNGLLMTIQQEEE